MLTYSKTLKSASVIEEPVFFIPLIISRTTTPKAKTSDLIENNPFNAYSGDMYPLRNSNLINGLVDFQIGG